MTSSTVCILATIFVYLVGMLVIGFHYAKKNESSTDFYLGGRKLGPLVTAMSAEASDMSSYLLMGLPGLAYLSGVADVGWTAIGLAVGTYLNWLLTAGRLRRYTHKTDSFTLPQFFSHRFRDKKNILSFMEKLYKKLSENNINVVVNRFGGMMTIFFTDKDAVRTYEDAKSCNLEMFKKYFLCMNKNGINIPQSQFEALFLSSEHNEEHVKKFLSAFKEFAENISKK